MRARSAAKRCSAAFCSRQAIASACPRTSVSASRRPANASPPPLGVWKSSPRPLKTPLLIVLHQFPNPLEVALDLFGGVGNLVGIVDRPRRQKDDQLSSLRTGIPRPE